MLRRNLCQVNEHMQQQKSTYFYAIGLSYKKADAEVRGHFSLSDEAKRNLLTQAKQNGIESVLVVSTCNRTELYGFAEHPYQLIHLLCENTKGTVEEFQDVAYVHKNKEAINHMFRVGSGLDSQILGDFEIISQIKFGARASKKEGLLNSFTERLVNTVIQASKRIKTETELSSGATSVSFASVQYIMNNVQNVTTKNILLFGTGKIGRNTCENLVKHTKNSHITLINRTKTKAEEVAGKFNLVVKDLKIMHPQKTGRLRFRLDKIPVRDPILLFYFFIKWRYTVVKLFPIALKVYAFNLFIFKKRLHNS